MKKHISERKKDELRLYICLLIEAGMDANEIIERLNISKSRLYRLRVDNKDTKKKIKTTDYDPEWNQFMYTRSGVKVELGLWGFSKNIANKVIDNKDIVKFLYDNDVKPSIIANVVNEHLSRATVYRIIKEYNDKEWIRKNNEDFEGTLDDFDCINNLGVKKKTYERYKRDLKADYEKL